MTPGAGLHVVEHEVPGAPLVVLVHGSMDRGASFGLVTRRLADLRVVRYDRRGYGRSRDVPAAADFAGHVDDLLSVLDGRRATVVGHSLGGLVALAAAARAPELVRAAGAYEAPTPWVDWWPQRSAGGDAMAADPASAAETFMRRVVGDERWEALPEHTRRDRRAEGPALLTEMRSLRRPPPPVDLTGITVPVVSARGSESIPHHRRTALEIAETVPGAELVEIAGAGHGAHVSHPEEFADLVRRVVTRAGEGR